MYRKLAQKKALALLYAFMVSNLQHYVVYLVKRKHKLGSNIIDPFSQKISGQE